MNYYIDLNTWGADHPYPLIIDEPTLEAAERGENYLNADAFIYHGEFTSPAAALQAYWDEIGDLVYCQQHDC